MPVSTRATTAWGVALACASTSAGECPPTRFGDASEEGALSARQPEDARSRVMARARGTFIASKAGVGRTNGLRPGRPRALRPVRQGGEAGRPVAVVAHVVLVRGAGQEALVDAVVREGGHDAAVAAH